MTQRQELATKFLCDFLDSFIKVYPLLCQSRRSRFIGHHPGGTWDTSAARISAADAAWRRWVCADIRIWLLWILLYWCDRLMKIKMIGRVFLLKLRFIEKFIIFVLWLTIIPNYISEPIKKEVTHRYKRTIRKGNRRSVDCIPQVFNHNCHRLRYGKGLTKVRYHSYTWKERIRHIELLALVLST